MEHTVWMARYAEAVRAAFGDRIVCIGLQGSRARGEATPESDIDAVLILDRVDAADLERYREAVSGLPDRDKLCGFVSGREELRCWEKGELFSFFHDTVPICGSLDYLLPELCPEDAESAVLAGACSIYHACVHDLLHARSPQLLAALQKSLFFTLRASHFRRTGLFVSRRADLLPLLPPQERRLLELNPSDHFAQVSSELIAWASSTIRSCGGCSCQSRKTEEANSHV